MDWWRVLARIERAVSHVPAIRKGALAGSLPRRLGGNVGMMAARRPELPLVMVHGVPIADWANLTLAYPEYDLLFARRSVDVRDLELAAPLDAVMLGPFVSGSFRAMVKERNLPTFTILPSPIPWLPLPNGGRAAGFILDSRGAWISARGRCEIDAFLDAVELVKLPGMDVAADFWLTRLALPIPDDPVTLIIPPFPSLTNDVERSWARLREIAAGLNAPVRELSPDLADWSTEQIFPRFEAELARGVGNVVTNSAPQGFHALLRGVEVHAVDVSTPYTMRGLTYDHGLNLRRGQSCSLNDLMSAVLTLSRFVEDEVGLVDPFDRAHWNG